MTKWWEKEPLRFECQPDCFKCCMKPGVVYFDRDDIRRAADHFRFTPAEFKSRYLVRDGGDWVLEVGGDQPCTFLTAAGCAIQDAKPKQCTAYPFWRENLTSKGMWRLVGVFCPGVDRGPMVLIETIKDLLKRFQG